MRALLKSFIYVLLFFSLLFITREPLLRSFIEWLLPGAKVGNISLSLNGPQSLSRLSYSTETVEIEIEEVVICQSLAKLLFLQPLSITINRPILKKYRAESSTGRALPIRTLKVVDGKIELPLFKSDQIELSFEPHSEEKNFLHISGTTPGSTLGTYSVEYEGPLTLFSIEDLPKIRGKWHLEKVKLPSCLVPIFGTSCDSKGSWNSEGQSDLKCEFISTLVELHLYGSLQSTQWSWTQPSFAKMGLSAPFFEWIGSELTSTDTPELLFEGNGSFSNFSLQKEILFRKQGDPAQELLISSFTVKKEDKRVDVELLFNKGDGRVVFNSSGSENTRIFLSNFPTLCSLFYPKWKWIEQIGPFLSMEWILLEDSFSLSASSQLFDIKKMLFEKRGQNWSLMNRASLQSRWIELESNRVVFDEEGPIALSIRGKGASFPLFSIEKEATSPISLSSSFNLTPTAIGTLTSSFFIDERWSRLSFLSPIQGMIQNENHSYPFSLEIDPLLLPVHSFEALLSLKKKQEGTLFVQYRKEKEHSVFSFDGADLPIELFQPLFRSLERSIKEKVSFFEKHSLTLEKFLEGQISFKGSLFSEEEALRVPEGQIVLYLPQQKDFSLDGTLQAQVNNLEFSFSNEGTFTGEIEVFSSGLSLLNRSILLDQGLFHFSKKRDSLTLNLNLLESRGGYLNTRIQSATSTPLLIDFHAMQFPFGYQQGRISGDLWVNENWDMDIDATLFKIQGKGNIVKDGMTLNEPLVLLLRSIPIEGFRLIKPFLVKIGTEKTLLSPFIEKIRIDHAWVSPIKASLSKDQFEHMGSLLSLDKTEEEIPLDIIPPCSEEEAILSKPTSLQVREGVLTLTRTELLIGKDNWLSFWGTVVLKDQKSRAYLGLTAPFLRERFAIEGLPKDFVLPVELKGPLFDLHLNEKQLLLQVASLTKEMVKQKTQVPLILDWLLDAKRKQSVPPLSCIPSFVQSPPFSQEREK